MQKGPASRFFLVVVIFLLAVEAIFAVATPSIGHSIATTGSDPSGYSLSSFSNFTSYGQFYVNETLSANSSAANSLSSLTLGFPSNYTGHMFSARAVGSFSASPRISTSTGANSTVLVTLTFPTALAAHTAGKLSFSFWTQGTYSVVAGSDDGTNTNYTAPATFYPSTSVPIDKLSSTLWFPYATTHVGSVASKYGFTDFVNASAIPVAYETWSLTTAPANATSLRYANIVVTSPNADSGNVEFTAAQRTISVGPDGNLLVTDSISVLNLGQNTISSMAVNLLTNATTVTSIPSSVPPLSNAGTASITGGEVGLSGINEQIGPNSKVTFILQYPLSSQYWTQSNGEYVANIPAILPVNGLVASYSLVFKVPGGYVSSTSGPTTYTASYTISGIPASFSYKSGIGSSFGNALPLAALAFLGVFVAAVVFKPRKGSEEERESAIDAMLKSIEDKVSGTSEILSELKARGSQVSRLDLANARTRVDELRTKSSGRLGSLRAELVGSGAATQSALNSVALNDREFDRAVKDLLNSYDQFISRRIKYEALSKVVQGHEHRVQRITNSLLDALEDLRHDYEQEQ